MLDAVVVNRPDQDGRAAHISVTARFGEFVAHLFASRDSYTVWIYPESVVTDDDWRPMPDDAWSRHHAWQCRKPRRAFTKGEPTCNHTRCAGTMSDDEALELLKNAACEFAVGMPSDVAIVEAGLRERSRREGIYIEHLGGMTPVQGEGWINGLPFYFRARHGSWTLDVAATEQGKPLEITFGRAPGWQREGRWSCRELPDTYRRDPECDHAHCAGFMPAEIAEQIVHVCAAELIAGMPTIEWHEPEISVAVRQLSEALKRGRLRLVEHERQDGEWFRVVSFEPVPDSEPTPPNGADAVSGTTHDG